MRMRGVLHATAVAALLSIVPVAGATAVAAAPSGEDVSVIVVLDHPADAPRVAHSLAAEHGGRSPAVFSHVLGGFQFVGSAGAVAALSHASGVRAVVPDRTFSL